MILSYGPSPLGKLSSTELRLFINLMYLIRGSRQKGLQWSFTFKQLKKTSHYNQSNQHLVENLRRIHNKLPVIKIKRANTMSVAPVWDSMDLLEKTQQIILQGNVHFMELLSTTKQWTLQQLEIFNKLRSVYSENIYRLIIEHEEAGHLRLPIEQLYEQLNLSESYQGNQSNINSRVLAPVKKELGAVFPDFKIKTERGDNRGHPVTAYDFIWDSSADRKQGEKKQLRQRPSLPEDTYLSETPKLANTWTGLFGEPSQTTAERLKLMVDEYGPRKVEARLKQLGNIMIPTVLTMLESSLEYDTGRLPSIKNDRAMEKSKQGEELDTEPAPSNYLPLRLQPNDLVSAFGGLNLIQHKIMDVCFSRVTDSQTVWLPIADILNALGMVGTAQNVQLIIDNFWKLVTWAPLMQVVRPTGRVVKRSARIFASGKYANNQLVYRISPQAMPLVKELQKCYDNNYWEVVPRVQHAGTLSLLKLWHIAKPDKWDPAHNHLPSARLKFTPGEIGKIFVGKDHPLPTIELYDEAINTATQELQGIYAPNVGTLEEEYFGRDNLLKKCIRIMAQD